MVNTVSARPHLAMALGALVALGALLACAAPGASAGGDSPAPAGPTATFVIYPTPTPASKDAVQQTVVAFCQALSDGKLSAAYSYLTTSFKSRIGSASRLPGALERTWGKTTGCSEFGDGFFVSVSGDHASDQVSFTVIMKTFGNTQQVGATVNLARSGSTWKIDSAG